ncbi:BREX-1 system adenine-specific DNA-methyltransferase PglX [Roseibaca sp. V10]|uniref:BREX-1 system adenine-specific DNA-methyltransferase PglX n=1 Tax=Roseinatronobacter domitianus TaxID=2940293 RepID=A0ABT0M4V5_9RHOB|nr:BREX-1 system adenine-specific DNA-methyltransferase PglX [Roseibaca domitiana]MCL1629883.1 BREX-1 system adenine-specific DNA-methyltransferase PglX [Roseibaca domitiana]
MALFFRLIGKDSQEDALKESSTSLRNSGHHPDVFEIDTADFRSIPGMPFAYWTGPGVRSAFKSFKSVKSQDVTVASGASSKDDERFLRLAWEIEIDDSNFPFLAKGGKFSPYYATVYLRINWRNDGEEIKTFVQDYRRARGFSPHWTAALLNAHLYFRSGLTWPRRTNGLSFRALPAGCVFGDKGPAVFVEYDDPQKLLALCAIANSEPFSILVSVRLARTELAQSFEVGLIQQTPLPKLTPDQSEVFSKLARRAWSTQRILATVDETCPAFLLPIALRTRLGDYDPPSIAASLDDIQAEIDTIALELYRFGEADRAAALGSSGATGEVDSDGAEDADDNEDDDGDEAVDQTDGLLSWAAGVAFGRFDWRLATGEREAPPEPEPFDPLPAKSPGMLPDDAEPFYAHSGILVDDQGNPNDLARLIEEVLARVEAPVPADVRRWLQRDFFPLHLKQYSKSRRKAPIYWPLSTASGSYTLWLYYPSLTSQTLYTAVNDFIDGPNGKLPQVGRDLVTLRDKGASRTREDEKVFEALQTFEQELIDLRDTLLEIAPTYRPNHDDGVQITAAPLWRLFRHKPWQKILKDTWAKLEKGDYDWAHLAMAYWPERVREKCTIDKSLAIAHDLEHLYVEPEPKAPKARGRKKRGDA